MSLIDSAARFISDKSDQFGHDYIPSYEKILQERRIMCKTLLEIGIGGSDHESAMQRAYGNAYQQGNSLRMWRDYFFNANIYAVDIDATSMLHNEEKIQTFVANQASESDLKTVIDSIGTNIDVIIDDGSHWVNHQVASFEILNRFLSVNGIYIIEDINPAVVEQFRDLSIFSAETRELILEKFDTELFDCRKKEAIESNRWADDYLFVLRRKPIAIPFYIIAYNNLTFVKSFVEQICNFTNDIVIIDNASTYGAMFKYYDFIERHLKAHVTVCRLDKNYGHEVYRLRPDLFPKVYILSDPDLELQPATPVNVAQILWQLSERYQSGRVGLALDISQKDQLLQGDYGSLFQKIESKYWENRLPQKDFEIYHAPIDTTFCLVNNNYRQETATHIRVAGDFTCKHLPWYQNYLRDNICREEAKYWIQNNKSSSILQHVNPFQ